MELSEDAKVVLLLCCPFQARDEAEEKSKVLSTKQWHELSQCLEQRHIQPQELLNFTEAQLREVLSAHKLNSEAQKIYGLLHSGVDLGFHLEKLSNKGIDVLTIVDKMYPTKLKKRLENQAPPFLFYVGDLALLGQEGIAIVGSRSIDEEVKKIAQDLGEFCGIAGTVLYSGGAKGVDQTSMQAALKAMDGYVVGVLAHPLTEVVRTVEYRQAIVKKRMCLVTPFMPDKGFQIWKAMARNKIVYALADYAVVIQSDHKKGGTWAGAMENLEKRWVPLFVIDLGEKTPKGNRELIDKRGIPLPYPFPFAPKTMMKWFEENSRNKREEGTPPSPSAEEPAENKRQPSTYQQGRLL